MTIATGTASSLPGTTQNAIIPRWLKTPTLNHTNQNHLLDALPLAEYQRIKADLELVPDFPAPYEQSSNKSGLPCASLL